MEVREITRAEAKPFVIEHHYSGNVPKTVKASYGAFDKRGKLYAVALYGTTGNRFSIGVFKRMSGSRYIHRWNTLELVRMCRRGEVGASKFPMTTLLSRAHQMLRRDHAIRFVISYSDPEHGHDGKVYRAANFRHMGMTDPEWHGVRPDGTHCTRRVWWRYQTSQGRHAVMMTAAEARTALGIRMVKSAPKDRWLIDLRLYGHPQPWD